MAAHRYRVLAADLLTGQIREEIPFQSITYGHQLNQPGTFQGTIGMRHKKATRANLDPGRTLIHVERDGNIVWSGILWTVRASHPGSNPSITCDAQGWWSYFKRRLLRQDLSYTAVDQLTVAAGVVNYALGVAGSPAGLAVASATSGVNITANWLGADRQNIATLVEQLASAANGAPGFDFAVDSAWSGASVASTLNWYYPRRGQRTGQVVDLAANLGTYEYDLDASNMANYIDATGAGSGATRLIASVADTTQLASYPLLEGVVNHTSVTDQPTLSNAANADLAQYKTPLESWPQTTVLASNLDAGIGTFRVGDSFQFRGSDGYIQTGGSDFQRVMAWTVSVDDNGLEILTMVSAPEAASQ